MSALNSFRVVELAASVAGEYCGKLLADFGAEVIKVEPPGWGSPTRAAAPRTGDGPDHERSGLFAYLNTNKRSIVLDLTRAADVARLHDVIATCDAVIDDHDARWARDTATSEDEMAAQHPRVVVCAITPYGREASVELANARSINVFHSSGWGYHTPSHADPTRPPLKGPGYHLADYEAGLDAALCVTAALFRQIHTGRGEYIDISQQAVLVSRADCILGRFISGEIAPESRRDDFDQQGPASFFACADGYVYLYLTSRSHWLALKTLLDQPAWLDEFDDDWLEFAVTAEKVALFHRGFAAWVADKRKDGVTEQAQRAGVPLVPVNGADDLHRLPQFSYRRFFSDVTHPVLGTAAYPTVGYAMGASPVCLRTAAPSLGQHTADVLGALDEPRKMPKSPPSQLKSVLRTRGGPLAGVRVVELTKVWAGPYAGKLLAFLGAEVIKVESAAIPEEMRAYGGTDINHAPYFLSINPEILSVDIDIKTDDGMDRLRTLIADSDIVINNLRPGAMERQGLGYEDLTAIKSGIIAVSIKMWGNDGPMGYQTGYAPCFAALAGLASLVGYEGGPPSGMSMRYGDSTVGAAAAFAAVAALMHREATGEGQFVDVSAVEVLSSMIGDRIVEQNLTGRRLEPDGNRHPDLVPHGCYPCADREWLALAVGADAEWASLCEVLEATDLAGDPRFSSAAARRANSAALDHALSDKTRTHHAGPLAQRLRTRGVAATKSATSVDVISDQCLWDRGAYLFVSDHVEGQRPVLGPSWRLRRAPAGIEHGAPLLGEHNSVFFEVAT